MRSTPRPPPAATRDAGRLTERHGGSRREGVASPAKNLVRFGACSELDRERAGGTPDVSLIHPGRRTIHPPDRSEYIGDNVVKKILKEHLGR